MRWPGSPQGTGARAPQDGGAAGHPGLHVCAQKRPPHPLCPGSSWQREGLLPRGTKAEKQACRARCDRACHVLAPRGPACPFSIPFLDPGLFCGHMRSTGFSEGSFQRKHTASEPRLGSMLLPDSREADTNRAQPSVTSTRRVCGYVCRPFCCCPNGPVRPAAVPGTAEHRARSQREDAWHRLSLEHSKLRPVSALRLLPGAQDRRASAGQETCGRRVRSEPRTLGPSV